MQFFSLIGLLKEISSQLNIFRVLSGLLYVS